MAHDHVSCLGAEAPPPPPLEVEEGVSVWVGSGSQVGGCWL